MSKHSVRLEIGKTDNSPWYGDLALGSFATTRTAKELGDIVARALAQHTGAGVTAEVFEGDLRQVNPAGASLMESEEAAKALAAPGFGARRLAERTIARETRHWRASQARILRSAS